MKSNPIPIFHSIFISILYFSTIVFSCSNFSLCIDNNQLNQNRVNGFINDIFTSHFPNCYAIHVEQTKEYSPRFSKLFIRKIPTIWMSTYKTNNDTRRFLLHPHDTVDHTFFPRFGKQCIVYEVVLGGLNFNEEFLPIFTNKESQRRAKISYVFINENENHIAAKDFLLNSMLKNFPHRVWANVVPEDDYDVHNSIDIDHNWFKFQSFCYYCEEGNQGVRLSDKTYNSASSIGVLNEIFPVVTDNFNGHVMRVTAPPAPPLVLITPSKKDPQTNVIHGQQKNILYSIADKFNFTCQLYTAPGGTTGSRLPNGTWNGVMGEILYGRADIGLTVATAYDRKDIADFTVSVFYAFLVLVSTKPIPLFEWQAIFYPFKATAWIALIASTIMTLHLYQFLHNNSLKLEVAHRRKWKSKLLILQQIKLEIMSTFRAFYMTVGSLLEQGVPVDYNTMPSRMIATFWMFFAIIITCAYRSKLFSFLVSPTIEIPPSSFKELAISDYTWGMKSLGGIALLFITQSPLLYIRNIGEQMEIYTDKYTCLDKAFQKKFTCIIYRAYIDYMMEVRYWKLKHQFHISDFVTPPVGSAWALAKYSPLQKNFDKMSFRIYEMGLADKYLVDYQVSFAKAARVLAQASNVTDDTFPLNDNFKNDDDSGPKPLVMQNLYGGFFILGVGILISAVILMVENIKFNKIVLKQRKIWLLIRFRLKILKQRSNKKNVSFPQLVKLVLPNISELYNNY